MAKRPTDPNDSHGFKVAPSINDRLRDDLAIWGLCLGLVTLLVAVFFYLEGGPRPFLESIKVDAVEEMPVGLPHAGPNP